MAEEQTAQPVNEGQSEGLGESQDSGQQDSYQQLHQEVEEEIVNNDGTSLDDELREDAEKPTPKGQQAAEQVEGKEADSDKGDALKPPKAGFLAGYFADAEDGSTTFDTDKFSKDVLGDTKNPFSYGEREYAPDSQQKQGEQQGEEDEYVRTFREEKKFRATVQSNLMMYRTELDKALKAGLPLAEADNVAQAAVQKLYQDFVEERDLLRRAEESKSAKSQAEKIHEEATLKAKSDANVSKVVAEVGGMDRWQALLMQHGMEPLNFLFDLSNPGFKGTKEETNKAIATFWRQMSSNEKSLRMFVRMMWGEVARNGLPHAFKSGMRAAGKTGQQNKATHSRAMGNRGGSRAPKSESATRDSVDAWLNPSGSREELVDTV